MTTQEFEQRLTEHLSRFVAEVLESDARASAPTHSRAVGCAEAPGGGPDWGVVPRAEITIAAGDKAEKYFEDLETWVSRNGFGDPTDNKQPGRPWVVDALSEDGARLVMELPPKSPQFAVTLTGPCTWPPDRPGGPPPSGQLPPLPAPSEPTQTYDSDSEERACRSPKLYVYNQAAPRFAGPGPHPMLLINYRDEESFGYAELPAKFEPQDNDHASRSYRDQVQLLVCARVEPTRDSGRDVTCYYSPISTTRGTPYIFDVHESTYHVAVLEAGSGKRVSEFTVPGRQGDEESCPDTMPWGDHPRTLARGIDEAAFESKLRPLYSSPR
ncbi:hypothetical protein [Micromonospora deserti]|uniref:Uncharacterized protein n=1 Tax=Micromonospora deserti TaxID=2070366 RepID=A0A2W2CQ04_9ACTN|nr:hypothetical protein [Micromonospora deserti]PZG01622.1 hypothetical protein C1I99_06295 [Micromonospora deserti]